MITPDEYYADMAAAYDPVEVPDDDGEYSEYCTYCEGNDHSEQNECLNYIGSHPENICPTCKRLAQSAEYVTDGSYCTCGGICPLATGDSECYWHDWTGHCLVQATA